MSAHCCLCCCRFTAPSFLLLLWCVTLIAGGTVAWCSGRVFLLLLL
ncbi:mucin-associated surface protein (MASP), putative, partial [Trypanosoma cruzi]